MLLFLKYTSHDMTYFCFAYTEIFMDYTPHYHEYIYTTVKKRSIIVNELIICINNISVKKNIAGVDGYTEHKVFYWRFSAGKS